MNQLCPLCGSPASYEIAHDPYGKRFSCPCCIDFFIDSSSENYIGSTPEVTKSEMRQNLSIASKGALPGRFLVIREPRDDELGGDGHGVACTQLVAEWQSR